jgi:hypothetical protein
LLECAIIIGAFLSVVEYDIEENGYLRFYLAPKIEDEENMEAER